MFDSSQCRLSGISWRAESRGGCIGWLEICGGASLVLRAIRGGEQSENAEMGWSRPGIAWKGKRLRVLLRIEWKARKKHRFLVVKHNAHSTLIRQAVLRTLAPFLGIGISTA